MCDSKKKNRCKLSEDNEGEEDSWDEYLRLISAQTRLFFVQSRELEFSSTCAKQMVNKK